MPGLGSLDVELLSWIFELVDDSSPQTIRSLRFVSKYFFATTKLVAHRHKTLRFSRQWFQPDATEIEQWLKSDDILRGLRYLTIELNHYPPDKERYEDRDSKWATLNTLLEKLGNLKLLVWNHPSMIPLPVLNALHTHQKKAELQIYKFEREEQTADENDPAEIALANSPALTAIKASFQNNGERPDLRDACFKRIVATAPNLKFASLSRYSMGCVVYGYTMEEMGERDQLAEKFYTHQKTNSSLRRLTLDGYGMSEQLLEHWARFVDLSKLENIKCSSGYPDPSYFKKAPEVLTGLKQISLNLSYGFDGDDALATLENYLSTSAPLQSLSLWSWIGKVSLTSVLARHGESLETLQLHERENTATQPEHKRKVLSADEVKEIRLACPRLVDLTIDCDRPSEELDTDIESDAVLKELKEIENLSKLQIYYPLGICALANRGAAHVPFGYIHDSDSEEDEEDEGENGGYNNDDTDQPGEEEEDVDNENNDVANEESVESEVKSKPSIGFAPSSAANIDTYVRRVWKYIFGHRSNPGVLEAKFGEWERKM